jgi:hypothetical protein
MEFSKLTQDLMRSSLTWSNNAHQSLGFENPALFVQHNCNAIDKLKDIYLLHFWAYRYVWHQPIRALKKA